LLRRPKQKFSSVFEAPLSDKLHAGVELLYSGRSDDYGNVQLGSYTLVNLRANYDLSSELKLGLRLENLGDKNYQLVYGYNTPGRSGYLTLSWEPHF
jgi:vitamin B12 transporter